MKGFGLRNNRRLELKLVLAPISNGVLPVDTENVLCCASWVLLGSRAAVASSVVGSCFALTGDNGLESEQVHTHLQHRAWRNPSPNRCAATCDDVARLKLPVEVYRHNGSERMIMTINALTAR
jgi:hypothetical protein